MRLHLPLWFPLRFLVLEALMALCTVLLCLLPLWYFSNQLDGEIENLKTRIQVQNTLSPLMEGLEQRRVETGKLIGTKSTLPAPENLSGIVDSLQQLVKLSGMDSARFVPAAETVVERSSIRLDGTLSGDPDTFRRLVLLLSDQPWITGMEFLNVTPTSTNPSFSLGVWATFTQQQTMQH